MITRTQFDTLAAAAQDYAVSIFIPTYRVGNQKEDQLRLKNALKKASEKLEFRYGLTSEQAHTFLAEAQQLESNTEFWQDQSDGLALFIGSDRFEYYSCPVDFEPMVYVAPEFYLRPLIPMLGDTQRFHVLALSRGSAKLYTATQFTISEVDTSGIVPVNMEAALLQDTTDGNLGRAGGAEGGRGNSNQVYFGRGGQTGDEVEDLKAYFDRVDAGVSDYLCDDRAPLLLGGVDELIPIYQRANTYGHLYTAGHVSGNLEETGMAMLHEKAWAAISTYFDEQAARDLKLYGDNLAEKEAGDDLKTIVPAAVNGRIAALWLDRTRYAYGEFRAQTNDIKVMTDEDKNATELFNLAAVRAFESGARVYNVDREGLPAASSGMCAIYRYSVNSDSTNA